MVRGVVSLAASAIYLLAAAGELLSDLRDRLTTRWLLIAFLVLHGAVFALGTFEGMTLVAPITPVIPLSDWFGIIHFEQVVFAMGSAIFLVAMVRERREMQHRNAAHEEREAHRRQRSRKNAPAGPGQRRHEESASQEERPPAAEIAQRSGREAHSDGPEQQSETEPFPAVLEGHGGQDDGHRDGDQRDRVGGREEDHRDRESDRGTPSGAPNYPTGRLHPLSSRDPRCTGAVRGSARA